jgi:hypothetical protein
MSIEMERTMRKFNLITVMALLVIARGASGDTAQMRSGNVIQGKYAGGTATTVQFQTADGTATLQTSNIVSLTFGDASAGAPAAQAAPAAPAAQAVPAAAATPAQPISVPAGTILTVKLDNEVSSKNKPGTKFTGKLLADITADGKTVAKAGSTVTGQVDESKQAGRLVGKSELKISLVGVDIGGKAQPIVTTNYAEKGKGEFRKTARNTATGALIGHAVDDDSGAGTGAAIGAGVSLIKKGDAVTAPAGMILEFRLSQPFQSGSAQ